jgi:spermidine synthase
VIRRARSARPAWQVEADRDQPTISELDGIRYLHFNSEWIQGVMRIGRPSELVLAYTRQMMAWLLFLRPGSRDRVGILGLGAGSLLRFTLRHTRALVDTVERNQRVVGICQTYFRLPGSSRSTITLGDARDWVARPDQVGRYRALMVDLYDADAQGPVCGDLDFYRHCARALDEPGLMTVNLFGHHESFASNLRHIREAFGGCVLCLPEIDEGNTVVLASRTPLAPASLHDWLDRAQVLESRTGLPAQHWVHGLMADPGFPWQGA